MILGDDVMKIKDGFILKDIGEQSVVVATGEASENFYGMIKLNQTGKIIWEGVSANLSVEDIVLNILDIYDDIEKNKVESDVCHMIDDMIKAGFLLDE